jgi:hypothetical protein
MFVAFSRLFGAACRWCIAVYRNVEDNRFEARSLKVGGLVLFCPQSFVRNEIQRRLTMKRMLGFVLALAVMVGMSMPAFSATAQGQGTTKKADKATKDAATKDAAATKDSATKDKKTADSKPGTKKGGDKKTADKKTGDKKATADKKTADAPSADRK